MSWSNLTRNQKLVTVFTVFSALGHILFSWGWKFEILGINLGVWFVINGVGFLVFLYLLYFSDQFHENKDLIRYLFAGWTIASIIAWAIFHTRNDQYNTLLDASLINKSAEVLILVFLYLDMRSSSSVEN